MTGRALDRVFERRLAALANARAPQLVAGGKRGLEKESLRVTPEGALAHTVHPRALGSALTHGQITTDYSESLLELVTPPFTSNVELLDYLHDLQRYVYAQLDGELLWAASMPCDIAGDEAVPIAHYGPSNAGRFKQVYRRGLLTRYGGLMQAIAGIHFNYSFPAQFWPLWADVNAQSKPDQAFISASYFALLRNYRRLGWLVPWLFGASPALCSSFLQGRRDPLLRSFNARTSLAPFATSLRMSDLGYRNRSQSRVQVSVNSMDAYVHDLAAAVRTPHPPYEALGIERDGEYLQLNGNLLQIENEYYSSIRPKRVLRAGETLCQALLRSGVEYVEVRTLDLNPFAPAGVDADQLCLIEALLLLLLARDAAPIEAGEQAELDANQLKVARAGRDPALRLQRAGREIAARSWLAEVLDQLQGCCELLDAGTHSRQYTRALALACAAHADTDLLPSGRVLRAIEEHGGFLEHALSESRSHADYYVKSRFHRPERAAELQRESELSLEKQEHMDRSADLDFASYVARQHQNYLRIP